MTTAFAKTLDHLLGPAHFAVTISGVPGSTEIQHFTSSRELITQIANARVWGGIHFCFATRAGTQIGIAVARYDAAHALQPQRDD